MAYPKGTYVARNGAWRSANGDGPAYATSDLGGFVVPTEPPGPTTTGFRVAEADLANYAGSFTNVQTGDRITRLAVEGGIDVPKGVSDVEFEDCLANLHGMPQVGQQVGLRQFGADTTGIVMRHSTIRCAPADRTYFIAAAAQGRALTLEACDLSGVTDGFKPSAIARVRGYGALLGCWIHDQPHYTYDGYPERPGSHSDGSHDDGVQAGGGLDYCWIIGNNIDAPYSAGILVTNDTGLGYTPGGLRVEDNWVQVGHPNAGSLLNFTHSLMLTGASIKRNRLNTEGDTSMAAILMRREALDELLVTGGLVLNGRDANVMVDDTDTITAYARYYTATGLYPTAAEAVYP